MSTAITFEEVINMLELSKGRRFRNLEDAISFITLDLNLLNCKNKDHKLIHNIENPYDDCIWCGDEKIGYSHDCFGGDSLSSWRTYWDEDF